jgi:hypothetical protein
MSEPLIFQDPEFIKHAELSAKANALRNNMIQTVYPGITDRDFLYGTQGTDSSDLRDEWLLLDSFARAAADSPSAAPITWHKRAFEHLAGSMFVRSVDWDSLDTESELLDAHSEFTANFIENGLTGRHFEVVQTAAAVAVQNLTEQGARNV